MKYFTAFALFLFIIPNSYGQKPAWVDNPGSYAYENFVAIGIAKDSKPDKAREKSQKKVSKGIQKILKNKYSEKDIKKAIASLRFEAYWLDPASKYTYCLGLLPIESIDKNYAVQKNLLKAKASALDATKMLNDMNKDPDIIIIRAEEDDSMDSETEDADKSGGTLEGVTDDHTKTINDKQPAKTRNLIGGDKTLGEFKWVDQDGNSKCEFLGKSLIVTAGTGEAFVPEDENNSAPRIELQNVRGNFEIEAQVSCDWSKYYSAGFGLSAHKGKSNVRTFVLYNGTYFYMKGSDKEVELPASEKNIDTPKGFIYLKLVKKDYTFTSYFSTIAGEWIETGIFETAFPDDLSLGIYFLNETESSVQFKVESVSVKQ